MPKYALRYLSTKDPYARQLEGLPSFGPNGNLTGMRKNFGWENAMPVKSGQYVYDCSSKPFLYERAG
jgi:hypothetical protein